MDSNFQFLVASPSEGDGTQVSKMRAILTTGQKSQSNADVGPRLVELLDRCGIAAAHFASRGTADLKGSDLDGIGPFLAGMFVAGHGLRAEWRGPTCRRSTVSCCSNLLGCALNLSC